MTIELMSHKYIHFAAINDNDKLFAPRFLPMNFTSRFILINVVNEILCDILVCVSFLYIWHLLYKYLLYFFGIIHQHDAGAVVYLGIRKIIFNSSTVKSIIIEACFSLCGKCNRINANFKRQIKLFNHLCYKSTWHPAYRYNMPILNENSCLMYANEIW